MRTNSCKNVGLNVETSLNNKTNNDRANNLELRSSAL